MRPTKGRRRSCQVALGRIVAEIMGASLLVFDLDGTLADSAPDLLSTLDVVLPRHGFRIPRDPGLRNGIGNGARHLIEYALQQQGIAADTPILDAIHRDFLVYYEANI